MIKTKNAKTSIPKEGNHIIKLQCYVIEHTNDAFTKRGVVFTKVSNNNVSISTAFKTASLLSVKEGVGLYNSWVY